MFGMNESPSLNLFHHQRARLHVLTSSCTMRSQVSLISPFISLPPIRLFYYGCVKLISFVKLTEQLHKMNVGWTRDSVKSTGERSVQKITRALWYINPHHEKFASCGIKLLPSIGVFHCYNDYKRKKEKEPRISADELLQKTRTSD